MTVKLEQLPLPGDRVAIAVYNFTDQTGQFKPTEGVQTLSRAVTQGATSILVKALQEAGNHGWFTVIERERLDNLLRERAVISELRAAYLGEKTLNRQRSEEHTPDLQSLMPTSYPASRLNTTSRKQN